MVVSGSASGEVGGAPDPGRLVTGVAVPALFGLMTYLFIRQHSWRPVESIATVTVYVTTVAAAIMLAVLASGKRLVFPRELFLPLGVLAASLLVSVLFSSWPAATSRQLMLYVSMCFFACATYVLYRDRPIPIGAFCSIVAVVHLPFVLEIALWTKDLHGSFYPQGAQVPNFKHVRHFGQLGFVAAMCGTALAAQTKRLVLVPLLLGAGALFGVIAMGSRGALLGWLVFVFLLATMSRGRVRIVVQAGVTALIAGGAVWFLHTTGILETPNVFHRVMTESGAVPLDSGRLAIWKGALHEIGAHPIFGQGPDAYERSGCCNRAARQPHNWVLQFLMEFGIAGLATAGFVAWRAVRVFGGIRTLTGRVGSSPVSAVMAAAIGAFLVFGLLDGLLYWPMPLLHFALFCGLFGAGIHQGRVQGLQTLEVAGLTNRLRPSM